MQTFMLETPWQFIHISGQVSENQESADLGSQENSFTRTIDEEAEMEEQAEREREEGHPEQEEEDEDRDHELLTAGSEYSRV